jgi:UDPglucose--hexose-1-phosphate uridylyltransferase
MSLAFRSEKKLTVLLDPRHDFGQAEIESEIRFDPLTGDTARICHFTGMTPQAPDMAALAASTHRGCPFCVERVKQVTPKFTAEFLRDFAAVGSAAVDGRLQRGEVTLFPNLFPYDDISAIAVMSEAHFLPSAKIPPMVVADAVKLARDFFIYSTHSQLATAETYGLLTWNYLPASGGSQMHPHMQVALTRHPGNRLRRELAAESAYLAAHGRCYGADLLDAERDGPRWLMADQAAAWLVPYAPTGVMGDALALFPGKSSVADLSDADIEAFAASLVRLVAGFGAQGLESFNLSFFPDHAGNRSGRHWLSARLLPRLYLNNALHVSDASYLQLLLQESFCMRHPEAVAQQLRDYCTAPSF